MTFREVARTVFAALFMLAGLLHFVVPAFYVGIMPSYMPAPAALVAMSGVAEIAGGVGLLLPRWRGAAGVGLIALLVAVVPANVEMLRHARERGAPPLQEALLWLRLPLQGLLMWWAWRLSRPPAKASRSIPN